MALNLTIEREMPTELRSSCLAPPADSVPAVADGFFELLPGPSVALLPIASGVRLNSRPIAVTIARVGRDVIAVAVSRGPTIIGRTTLCKGSIIMRSELMLIRRKVTRAWR